MAGGTEIRNIVYNIRSLTAKETSKTIAELDKNWGKLNTRVLESRKRISNFNEELVYTIDELAEVAQYVDKLEGKLGNLTGSSRSAANALENISRETDQLVNSAANSERTLSSMLDVLNDMNHTAVTTAGATSATEEAIDKMGKGAKKAGGRFDKFGNQVKQAGNKGKGATKKFSALTSAIGGGGLLSGFAQLAATLYVVDTAFRGLKESADLTRLEENIAALGNGRNLRGLAVELQAVAEGSLSADAALRLAAQSAAFSFDAKTITKFTKQAKQASIALGIDFNDALSRLTKGIAKQEVELLDELGIVTRLEPAMKKYAQSINKTVQQLTDVERKTALATEASLQLEKAYGSINVTSTEYERVSANLATITRQLGKSLAETLEPVLGVINAGFKTYIDSLGRLAVAEGAVSAGDTAKGLVANANAMEDSAKAVKYYEAALKSANDEIQLNIQTGASYSVLQRSVEKQTKATNDLAAARGALAQNLTVGGSRTSDQVKELENLQKQYKQSETTITQFAASSNKALVSYSDELQFSIGLAKTLGDTYAEQGSKSAETDKERDKLLNSINRAYGTGFKTVQEYSDAVQKASDSATGFAKTNQLIDSNNWKLKESVSTLAKIGVLNTRIADEKARGNLTGVKDLEAQKLTAKLALKAQEREETKAGYEKLFAHNQALALATSTAQGEAASEQLGIQVRFLDKRISAEDELLTELEKKALIRERDLVIQSKTIALVEEERAMRSAMYDRESSMAKLAAQTKGKPESVTAKIETADAKFAYDMAVAQGNLLAIETNRTALLIAQEKERIALIKEKYQVTVNGEASAALTGAFGNQDLATNAANKELGNKEAVWQHGAEGVKTAIDALSALDTATGQIASGFMSLGQIMNQSLTNGAFGADAAAASITAVSSIMSGNSAQAVSEIDHQIAMEKKRDGQSAKSVAKLKQLEAKKLKEQQKSKLQSAVMSTASGIASALELPFPYNLVAAGITGAMGLMQISTIRSQGKNASSLANASSGGAQSISFGSRMNNVDLSQSSSAGERAFVTGQSGTGTGANNFVGAAAGRDVEGGTAIQVGERGAEVFVPEVPGTIVPSGNTGQGIGGSGIQISMQIDNIDAQSFIDRKDDIMEALDAAVQAKYGKSLEDF